MLLDLFNKFILNLQQAVLPVFTTIQTLKELTDQCLAINQGLYQIKAYANQMKTRNLSNQAANTTRTAHTAPVQQSATFATPTAQPPINSIAGYTTTPAAPFVHTRPIYKSPP